MAEMLNKSMLKDDFNLNLEGLKDITEIKSYIECEFLGYINNYKITDKHVYYSSEYLLNKMIDKYKSITSNFIEEFIATIEIMYLKYDEFSFRDLENEFSSCIEEAEKFSDLKFEYFGSDWKIEKLNESIKYNFDLKSFVLPTIHNLEDELEI